jgi:hypothetical protein
MLVVATGTDNTGSGYTGGSDTSGASSATGGWDEYGDGASLHVFCMSSATSSDVGTASSDFPSTAAGTDMTDTATGAGLVPTDASAQPLELSVSTDITSTLPSGAIWPTAVTVTDPPILITMTITITEYLPGSSSFRPLLLEIDNDQLMENPDTDELRASGCHRSF